MHDKFMRKIKINDEDVSKSSHVRMKAKVVGFSLCGAQPALHYSA
jgi:hypothetical protein